MAAQPRVARSNGKRPGGRPPICRPEFAQQAEKLCKLGATDADLADFFGVATFTIRRWQFEYPEFCVALKLGKEPPNQRVERSLFHRANGYSYDTVKFVTFRGKVKKVPYREHVPPDTTACIFWLKNRRPAEWRDRVEIRDVSPPDPKAEATRMKMIAFLGKAIEERARLGLPRIFDDSPAATAPALIEAKPNPPIVSDVTRLSPRR